MKLKSAVLYQALKAAYTRLGISATYSAGSSKATFETGEFLITSAFLDSLAALDGVGAADGAVLNVFKTFTDDSSAAADATLAFFKVLEKYIGDYYYMKRLQIPNTIAEDSIINSDGQRGELVNNSNYSFDFFNYKKDQALDNDGHLGEGLIN